MAACLRKRIPGTNLQRRVPIVDSRYDVEIQFQLGVDVFEGKFTMVVGRGG